MGGPILIGEDGPGWQWQRRAWKPEFTAQHRRPSAFAPAGQREVWTMEQTPPGQAIALDPLFVTGHAGHRRPDVAFLCRKGHRLPRARPWMCPAPMTPWPCWVPLCGLATGESRWMKFLPPRPRGGTGRPAGGWRTAFPAGVPRPPAEGR